LPYQFELGETQFVNTDNRIFVANMIAQTLGGVRPLFYNHLARCMDSVAKFVIDCNNVGEHKSRIIAPLFGSALSGGDWNFVEKLIEDCWLRKDISVTIYYLKGQEPDSVLRSLTPAL